MTPRIWRRARHLTLALLPVAALVASGQASTTVGAARASTPLPHCHEFVRFGERWELCTGPDGLERHRLGVYPRG